MVACSGQMTLLGQGVFQATQPWVLYSGQGFWVWTEGGAMA